MVLLNLIPNGCRRLPQAGRWRNLPRATIGRARPWLVREPPGHTTPGY